MRRTPARDADAQPSRTLALACALLGNVIGGSSYVLTKIALDGLAPHAVVALRTIIAVAALVPLAGMAPLACVLRAPGPARAWLLAMGLAGYALPITLGNYGLATSTATNAALLIGLEPLAIVVLGALVLDEALGLLRMSAFALGLAGAIMLVGGGTDAPARAGDALLAVHAVLWAIYTVAAKPLLVRFEATAVSAASLVVALPVLLAVAAVEAACRPQPGGPLVPALAATLALGILLSAIMTLCWNTALRRLDAGELAGFVFLQPLTGAALGLLVRGEDLGPPALAGGGLVLCGVALLVHEARTAGRPLA